MNKIIALTVFLGLLATAAYGATAASSTLTAGTFLTTAVQVLDAVGNTTVDGKSGSAWLTVYTGDIYFGAGTSNDTIYVWGVARGSAGAVPTKVVRRFVNATIANWGNGTTAMESVQIADVTATFTATGTWVTSIFAVGGGYFAMFTIETASSTNSIYGYLLGPTASSFSSAGILYGAGASTTTADVAIGNAWYQNSTFYFIAVQQSVSSGTYSDAGLYLQGVFVNGTKVWSAATTITSSAPSTITSVANTNSPAAQGGMANATFAVVQWLTSTNNVKGVIVNLATPAVGATVTVASATDVRPNVGGAVGSTNLYGVAVGNNTGSSTYTLNLSVYANSTTSAATDLGFTFTNAYANSGNYPSVFYSTDYFAGTLVCATWKVTSANSYYAYKAIYANGTAYSSTSQTAILSESATAPTVFKDVAGGIWVGYYTVDTANGNIAYTAKVARLFSNLTNSGNTLMSVIAFVSMIVMSLFMF